MRRALLALLLLWAVLYLPGLGQSDLLSTNEANRALAAREMLARGDWVVPTLAGEPYLNKPPLYYWQAMLCYMLFGDHEVSARLPAALAALATILTAFFFLECGSLLPRERDAARGSKLPQSTWPGVLVAATPLLIMQGTEAELDMGLVLWVFLTELFMLQALCARPLRNTLLAYAFLALAILTKGPVALAFFAPMLIVQVWVGRASRPDAARTPSGTPHLAGLLVCLALVLPWCIAVVDRLGWDYAWTILKRESLERTMTASRINAEPFWFYLPRLLVGCLPWTPLLWLLRVHPPRNAGERLTRRYLGWCSAAQFVLFSLFAGKETQYLFPILPPLAVVVALALCAEMDDPRSRVPAWIGRACLAVVVVAAIGSVFASFLPRPEAQYSWRLALVAVPLAGFCLSEWRRRGASRWWAPALALVFLLTIANSFVRTPVRNARSSVKADMAAVLARLPNEAPVLVYRHGESQAYYYLHGRARAVHQPSQLAPGDCVLYELSAEPDLAGLPMQPLLEIPRPKKPLRLARVLGDS
ncbi:glycosyltransferase family 39 protein [bacterium]|nr:glycosyltransferase family 39 protein [bacterium]